MVEIKKNLMMVKNCELVALQNRIHAQNVEMGWWDDVRPFHVFACLFHSELSEAMEGDRKGLMDDHLPQYPMFQVELADFAIRCLDWLGCAHLSSYDYECSIEFAKADKMESIELIAWLHHTVSMALDSERLTPGMTVNYIISAVKACFVYADGKFDLMKIINEKVEYNKHRADHKRENRQLEGGKKY